ncbi:MAG: acyltransferase [Fimbriimonadaceae bacterium]|nr:MAG: acyltransferase [Fimbriimonadaceae bacterium]
MHGRICQGERLIATAQVAAPSVAVVDDRSRAIIKPLNGFRALAALWVVLVHIETLHSRDLPESAREFLRGYGILPVVFFFALSGFILTVVYLPRVEDSGFTKSRIKHYGWSRVARIVPLYLFSIIPGVLMHLIWLGNGNSRMPFVNETAIGSWGFARDGFLFNSLWRSNVPAWTLTAELLFYLMFPWVLGRIMQFDKPKLVHRFVWYSIGYFAIQLLFGLMQILGTGVIAKVGYGLGHFGSPIFIPVFIAGSLIGLAYYRGWVPEWVFRRPEAIYGTALVLTLSLTLYRWPHLPPSLVSGLLAPVYCLAILTAAGARGALNNWLASPVLQSLGAASYAIYITHWPTKEIAQPFLESLGFANRPVLMGLIVFGAVILVGYLAHFWVEKPVYKWVMKRADKV